MKKNSISLIIAFVFLLTTILSGCSGSNSESNNETNPNDDPASRAVTDFSKETIITIQHEWGLDQISALMQPIEDKLQAEGKNIKVKWIQGQATSEALQELNASGVVPDIIYTSKGIDALKDLDMVEPIDELSKIYGMDISSIDPSIVSLFRSFDDKGSMIGVPTFADTYTLFYNKEIFDMFGVPYPTDHMTWDETIELAKKMTGERDGVVYRGLEMGWQNSVTDDTLAPLKELVTNVVDPETDQVLLTSEPAVTRYFELMKKFYSVPGLYERDPKKAGSFFANGTAAMLVSWPTYMEWGIPENVRANTNSVLLPIWGGADQYAPTTTAHMYVLNKYSENKDAAFQWMKEVVAEDMQKKFSAAGYPTVLKNSEAIAVFGSEKDIYDGQNVKSYFPDNAKILEGKSSKWKKIAESMIVESLPDFASSDMNISEYLRKLQEKLEMKIADEKAKKE
ncbi:ABC transporter substrate-binding protein [Paenibacillus sp. GCM10027629]|uniref:ABC transporter substrate-binding protein n=1 Tax=Paenibacillus sp. GCM10027629 TaxID=3273414 RepID=UPI003625180B